MRDFLIIVSVFVGLALAVEFAYLRCIAIVNKMQFKLPKRNVERTYPKNTYVGRPELDFDLHVKRVDKLRFGDEV